MIMICDEKGIGRPIPFSGKGAGWKEQAGREKSRANV